jgi:hypothetical protein
MHVSRAAPHRLAAVSISSTAPRHPSRVPSVHADRVADRDEIHAGAVGGAIWKSHATTPTILRPSRFIR